MNQIKLSICDETKKTAHNPSTVSTNENNFMYLIQGSKTKTSARHKHTDESLKPGSSGQIKNINVFRVTSLKILGRVGTHFLIIFFLEKI